MSQTETLLLIVLGFALASLLALFVGRFFWAIAIRLGARRMQKQVPSTVKELQADRDRLRADYALISQKLGTHLETVKTRMAEQMAEVTRSRNRIQSLTEDVNVRDSEITLLKDRISTLEAEAATRTAELAKLQSDLAERSQMLTSLEAGLASAVLTDTSVTDEVAMASPGIENRIQKLSALSEEIAASRNKPEDATAPSLPADLDAKLAAAASDTAELQKELARLDAAWSERLKGADAEGGKAAAADDPSVANVVSLAKRFRNLNKDVAG
jgi:DNA repair exonuclease SbcCD ATPase subunit